MSDNNGPLETVTLKIDGKPMGSFEALDTGNSGAGWNIFLASQLLGPLKLTKGIHQMSLAEDAGGLLGGFAGVDLPADDLAAENIHDQIEIELTFRS